MPRHHAVQTFAVAQGAGPYDERPMLPDSLDLQVHLSRNDRRQPFFLVCEHDTVLVTLKGEGCVEYRESNVLRHNYEIGDHLYVPAGTPHRIVPASESLQYRYKLPESELEGVAWFCEACNTELYREVFELRSELAQEAYPRIAKAFNGDASRRTCGKCKTVHPVVDLSGYHWEQVAAELKKEAAAS